MTYKQAQERYGIQGRSTVLVWLRKHGQLNWSKGIEKPNTEVVCLILPLLKLQNNG